MSKVPVIPYRTISIALESLFPTTNGPRYTYLGIGSHWGKGKHVVYDSFDGCVYAIACILTEDELMKQLKGMV